MRPTTRVVLLALCLSAGGLRAQAPAGKGPPARVKEAQPWTALVEAHGGTREEARQAALNKAHERVATYLFQRHPSLLWRGRRLVGAGLVGAGRWLVL